MRILTAENEIVDTDIPTNDDFYYYSVLSFRDFKNPDFYFEKTYILEEWNSASMSLHIGQYTIVMPMHWSILCTDLEYVQSVPLYETPGRDFGIFCINPVDGYMPGFHTLRTSSIFPNTTWTAPPVRDKDMLVVPIGFEPTLHEDLERGPICAIFSPNKMEVYKPLSDIW